MSLYNFTYSPYTALFFAAFSACKKLSTKHPESAENRHFSLWAIDRFAFGHPESELEVIHAPSQSNAFLFSQKGIFLSTDLWYYLNKEQGYSYEELDYDSVLIKNAESILEVGPGYSGIFPIMWKYNFNYLSAPSVVRKLDSRGFNYLSTYPSLENVVKSMEIRREINEKWKVVPEHYQIF